MNNKTIVLLLAFNSFICAMRIDDQARRLKRISAHSDLKKRSQSLDQNLISNEIDAICDAVRMIEQGKWAQLRNFLASKRIDFADQKSGDLASFDLLVTAIEHNDFNACAILFEFEVNVNAPNPHIPSLTFLNRVIRKYNRAQGQLKTCLFRLCKQLIQQGALVTFGCIQSAQMGNHEEIIQLLARNLPRESLTH